MDFDKFIEKDVIEFLDKQAMLIAEKAAGLREEEFSLYEIDKDYSKDLDAALREDDLRKAKSIFEDVKNKYFKAPQNSLAKKRLYTMMEEVYERIKDFEAKEEGKKNLFETIKDYEEKGLFKMPELMPDQKVENFDLIINTVVEKEKALENIATKQPISDSDIQEAIKLYREMKQLIKGIPPQREKEKAKLYDAALGWFYTIKKLRENLTNTDTEKRKQEAVEDKKEAEQELALNQKLAEIRMSKEEIVGVHKKIADFINQEDIKNSILEYKQLRKLIDEFPKEMEEEKTALLADALSLYESINKLKQKMTKKKEEEKVKKAEEKTEADQKESIRADIAKKLESIKSLLAQKNALKAINEYKSLKELFANYPEEPADEKKQLYDNIIAAHKDIKFLEDNLKKTMIAQHEKKITSIDQELKQAHEFLDKGEAEEATQKLLEAKHKIQLLPNEAFDEKYRLLKEVEIIEHKILFVKNVQKITPLSIIQK